VLRSLFSLPADDRRDGLAALLCSYVTGPGRPSLFDGLAKTEGDFAFAGGKRRRFQRAWFAAVDEVVAARKRATSVGSQNDFLALLLAARDPETAAALSDVEIRDQCATMLGAGFETTSRALFWAAYLLTLDMAEQGRIREEIKAFPPERVTSLDDLLNWPRLCQALLEALRLYPPVSQITREAIATDVVAGEQVHPGTQVWISLWVMHRHRKFWHNPAAFMPRRFDGKPLSWNAGGAFLPFGTGPRICLGASFAMAEAQIILATLLSRFEISLENPRAVFPVANFTIFPSIEPGFALRSI
jgi:cytochrome P450